MTDGGAPVPSGAPRQREPASSSYTGALTFDSIREVIDADPFRPFTLRLANGRGLRVDRKKIKLPEPAFYTAPRWSPARRLGMAHARTAPWRSMPFPGWRTRRSDRGRRSRTSVPPGIAASAPAERPGRGPPASASAAPALEASASAPRERPAAPGALPAPVLIGRERERAGPVGTRHSVASDPANDIPVTGSGKL